MADNSQVQETIIGVQLQTIQMQKKVIATLKQCLDMANTRSEMQEELILRYKNIIEGKDEIIAKLEEGAGDAN